MREIRELQHKNDTLSLKYERLHSECISIIGSHRGY